MEETPLQKRPQATFHVIKKMVVFVVVLPQNDTFMTTLCLRLLSSQTVVVKKKTIGSDFVELLLYTCISGADLV